MELKYIDNIYNHVRIKLDINNQKIITSKNTIYFEN